MKIAHYIAAVALAGCSRSNAGKPPAGTPVRVATAAWANELSLMTPRILARLNAGRTGRVKEIRWVPGGPSPK